MKENARVTLGLLGLFALWEILGRAIPGAADILSTPSAILVQFWHDADLYRLHVEATVRSASIGFVCGNAAAILAALIFCRFPLLESLFRGVNIALFAIPPIVVGPVLVLVFSGSMPQIVLSALIVYFPTMAAMLVGLRDIDPRLVDVIHIYGGREQALMRFVRLRASLPALLAGLRVAASLAVLGAILGEFGSGARWGLGSFLLGSLGDGNAARLWGICLTATAIAMAGYGLFAWLGKRVVGATVAVTIAANKVPDQIAGGQSYTLPQRVLLLEIALSHSWKRLLDAVRSEGDWEAWIEFFLRGVEETATGALQTAQRLMELFDGDRHVDIPAHPTTACDVTGAGDTVAATLALGVAAGLPLMLAAHLANLAAGAVVREQGAAQLAHGDLRSLLDAAVRDAVG